MRPKLSRLISACASLLLVAGCVAPPADRPADLRSGAGVAPVLPVLSASPTPRLPDSQMTIVPALATAGPLPSDTPLVRGEVSSTSTATPHAPDLRATAGPLRPQASPAATGIAEVDRVIGAVLDANRDPGRSLRGLIRFLTTPCTTREGLGGPPKCNPGEPEGTPVEVFPVGGVEGSFVRRGDIDRLLQISVAGLYAVYKVPAKAYRADYWPAGDYGVVFLRPDNSFLVALVDKDGIVRLDNPAVGSADELSQWMGGEMVLPPAAQ